MIASIYVCKYPRKQFCLTSYSATRPGKSRCRRTQKAFSMHQQQLPPPEFADEDNGVRSPSPPLPPPVMGTASLPNQHVFDPRVQTRGHYSGSTLPLKSSLKKTSAVPRIVLAHRANSDEELRVWNHWSGPESNKPQKRLPPVGLSFSLKLAFY